MWAICTTWGVAPSFLPGSCEIYLNLVRYLAHENQPISPTFFFRTVHNESARMLKGLQNRGKGRKGLRRSSTELSTIL
ncbi:hypothetical protein AUP74_00296 [Microbulbifer aggregans]|uniref:Uncharacterized protein n=1 Tax=Microbulbifer aggregans TaxID=1769779 RepID=A0A1C9W3P7_9GAMM|nr:hypothetical protein AUP74_00296 [Microbulbifer aggregans]